MNLPTPEIHEVPAIAVPVNRASRLSFGLRSLFVLVTVVALPLAWTSHSLSWIRQRHRVLDGDTISRAYTRFDLPTDRRSPGGLWLFGEEGLAAIFLNPLKPADKHQIQRLFPEADVYEGP